MRGVKGVEEGGSGASAQNTKQCPAWSRKSDFSHQQLNGTMPWGAYDWAQMTVRQWLTVDLLSCVCVCVCGLSCLVISLDC